MASSDYDWRNKKEWKYKGAKNPLVDPQYIKDRDKLFAEHGNGWWWGDGWWNGKHTSSMEKQRKYREEKENESK